MSTITYQSTTIAGIKRRRSTFMDLTGRVYSRLTALRRMPVEQQTNSDARWECRCSCGKTTIVQRGNLVSGHTKSCGCLNSETTARRSTTHGEAPRKRGTKEYLSWCRIKDRCLNPNNKRFDRYGGAGITVCDRWLGDSGYTNFLHDMGRCPNGKRSVDRINNALGYSPENCRWADDFEQANNQRTNLKITHWGHTFGLCQWARLLGMCHSTLSIRLKHGWSVERAFTEQVHNPSGTSGRPARGYVHADEHPQLALTA